MKEVKDEEYVYGMITVFSVLCFLGMVALFTGKGIFNHNAYNTFALQADSWRQGRLDLGQDYPWLELAICYGKYYCSFPPFPSYVLFPFTFIWGSNTYDYLLLWICNVISAVFTYKIALECKISPKGAMVQAVFVIIASNMVFIMVDPAVWFLAQTMCFMLSVLSIFYAQKGKGAASLFFWAASVGCRPMQAVFLPVLLIMLYRRVRKKEPESTWYIVLLKKWYWGIPAGVLAVSYMVLNYLRFGNVLEFGHNYLPEFVRAENGQFHISYVKENLKTLFYIPDIFKDGKFTINPYGRLNLFIVSPIILFGILLLFYAIIKREYRLSVKCAGIYLLSVVYLFIVVMHRTMGARHFGNRYTNDILPWIYLSVCICISHFSEMIKYEVPLCIYGMCLNAVGTVAVYNGFV